MTGYDSPHNDMTAAGSGNRGSGRWGARVPVFVVALLLAMPLLGAIPVTAAANPSANLDQCRNGTVATPTNPCIWTNGNLGSSNSHFVEGESVPFRIVVSNLVPGPTVHTLTIGYDVRNSGQNAYDYLTHFQRIAETVNPCFGVSPCALTDTEPIPVPAGVPQPSTSFNSLPPAQRVMSMYQGNIVSITYGTQGNLAAATSETTLVIQFTAASSQVVLAWGGHIASGVDWGTGNGASGISGSPYHMRLKDLDGGGGNQDRSLQAAAVAAVKPKGDLTVIKQVINDNGGTLTAANFVVAVRNATSAHAPGSPQPGSATGTVYANLPAGTFTVSETPVSGYQLTFSGDCNSSGVVTVTAGSSKTCTLTNNDVQPTLTVNKLVINDDGGTATASAWTLYVNGTQVANGVPTGFNAGFYVVSEQGLPGYTATFSGDCNSQGQVTLTLGTAKSCTITNNDIRPRLTVTKVVLNDNGGTATVSDFPLFVDTTSVTSGVQNTFAAGAHVVSETEKAGYTATITGDCDSDGGVALAPGDVKACTITNDDIQPRLTVVKMIVNDDGGTAVVSDAELYVDGNPVESGVEGGFDAGLHVVTEVGPVGYSPEFSGDCDAGGNVTLAVGEVKTCVITNDDIRPVLTVTKLVINDNGGTLGVADFQLFVDGNLVTSGEANGYRAGLHTVSETESSGYTASIAGQCATDGSILLGPGDIKSCTITNDDIQPKLTVVKRVVNDDGGEATVADFMLYVEGQSVLSGDAHGFDAGMYNVTEAGPAGYSAVFSGDCDANGKVTLAVGDDETCIITNDDVRPLLTVTKVVVNDNGGTAVVADWALDVNGATVTSGVQAGFPQGTYAVGEVGPAGYAHSYSGDCDTQGSLTLVLGAVKQCTLTNDDVSPLLTVVKIVVNDDGGDATVAAWNLYVDDEQVANGTTNAFDAGTHQVSELGVSGYTATFGGDCNSAGQVALAVGDNKTCTITNDDIRPLLTVTKTVVNDDGGPAQVSDFPLFVDADSVTSGEENSFQVGTHTVSETTRQGYAATIGGDCDDNGQVSLMPGDVKACTITNDDVRPTLTVVKMVVNDDGGTSVVADAELFVDGVPVDSGATNGYDVGPHTVTENGPPGYSPSFSGDCDDNGAVTLAPGDAKTCVITNDDIEPVLTVTKVVVNDNGGTAVVADFPLWVDATAVTSGEAGGFAAGAHVVSENGRPAYTMTITGDCNQNGNITLAPGDVQSCTVTNDDVQARLTVIKMVTNDDGGQATVQDFFLYVNGQSVVSGDGHGFDAGTYTVTESGPRGYAGSFAGDCDSQGNVTLTVGDDKTCIVTNDDIRPLLTVTKVVLNDDRGTALVSDFDLFVGPTRVTSGVQAGFDASAYVVTEQGPDGYGLTIGGDCDGDGSITLFVGDVKSCTLTNDDDFVPEDPPVVCPSNLQATSNDDGTVTVSWTPAPGSDATRLYRAVGDGPAVLLGSFDSGTTQYIDSDIAPNQTYTYTVIGMFGSEESAGCESVQFGSIPDFPTLIALALALVAGPLAYVLVRRRKNTGL